MSVEYKKNGNGKCPVMHGGITKAGESNTARLLPNSINLDILLPPVSLRVPTLQTLHKNLKIRYYSRVCHIVIHTKLYLRLRFHQKN